jgi:type II secretory pathway component GspD/PulD (secretin)
MRQPQAISRDKIMKTQFFKWNRCITVLLALSLFAVCDIHAQQQPGGARPGGGQGGGFGGGYGGGFNRNAATPQSGSANSSQYNAAGTVGNATISVDPDTHSITIIADDDTTKYIAEVITNLDRPQPQVLIKVVFVQVTHSDALDFGVEGGWMNGIGASLTGAVANSFGLSSLSSGTGSNAGVNNAFGLPISSFQQIAPFASGPGAGMYQVLGNDFQATLRAIAAAGKAEILSRPSILARNDQPASVVVGQYVPLVTSVSFNSISGAPINSITYTDVGIILTVTPYITSDGMVQMIVAPQTSSIDPTLTVAIAQGVNAPVIDTISANTVAITPSGQPIVIGGLMQRTKSAAETKIPFLGDIPVLGNLFKRKTTSTAKEELLIFLTPYVIQAPSQIASMSDYERSHSLVPKSYSEQELDKLLDKLPTKPVKGKQLVPNQP